MFENGTKHKLDVWSHFVFFLLFPFKLIFRVFRVFKIRFVLGGGGGGLLVELFAPENKQNPVFLNAKRKTYRKILIKLLLLQLLNNFADNIVHS